MPRFSAVLALVVAAGEARAEATEPTATTRSLRAARRSGEIRIDGHADEPAWKTAQVGENFIQAEPDDGRPATAATRFRILWDDDSLYVAIECDEHEVRARNVPLLAGASVLCLDADTDLHRRPADVVDLRAQSEDLAEEHRLDEAHLVHRCRHDPAAAVLHGRDPGGRIAKLHDDATVDVIREIRVADLHHLRENRRRLRRRVRLQSHASTPCARATSPAISPTIRVRSKSFGV